MGKLVSSAALVFVFAVALRADDAESAAGKWVEKVGGKTTRDAKLPGNPVVAVSFGPLNKAMTNDGLKELKAFPNLKSLTIFFCEQITDEGMVHVKELKSLDSLGLGNTSVTDDGLAELKDLKGLKVLRLAGCIRMTDKATETIKGFTDLEELTLPSTISEVGVKRLLGLKKLKYLYLSGTSIGDSAVKNISTFSELETLYLGSEVTDEAIPDLVRLTKLKRLNLFGSKITGKGLEQLKKSLPDCKVTR